MNSEPKRVLFALSPETKDSFFPNFDRLVFPQADHAWMDVSGLKTENWERLLYEKQPEVLVTGWYTPSLPASLACRMDGPLRYVCHLAGSVRFSLPRTLIERGVLVTNWGSSISYSVAEHAILLLLGALRGMPLWRSCVEASATGAQKGATLRTRSLRGRNVGIHGFGSVAREIVSLLKPFGVSISAFSAGVPARLFAEKGVRKCVSLEELFSTSDVLIECEALTPETEGSVTEAILRKLPEQAVFVNVGRGSVVDEEALGRLADEGEIRVALDVFREEPLPVDSLLLSNPETLLSPHIAGPTGDVLPLCGEFALKNLRHYLAGEIDRLEGVITTDIYDRIT